LQERYEHVQRATDKDRRDNLMVYIAHHIAAERPIIGAFPAISIGMTHPVVFECPGQDPDVGYLQLEISGASQRILLDGLARVTASLLLIEREEAAHPYQEASTVTQQLFTFPVTFYAPITGILTLDELGQLFYDFNYLQKRISTSHAIALDQSDLYIRLTNHLGNTVLARYGGMDSRSSSLTKKSKALVVQQVLLRFVRGACEGYTFQISNRAHVDTPNLSLDSYQHLTQHVENYLMTLADKMGEARFTDRMSLHLTSPGWQVLGLIFHDLYIRLETSPSTVDNVLQRLAGIDWTRYNPDWVPYLGEPEVSKDTGELVQDDQGRTRVTITRLGAEGIRRLRDYVYERTGLAVLTADLPQDAAA